MVLKLSTYTCYIRQTYCATFIALEIYKIISESHSQQFKANKNIVSFGTQVISHHQNDISNTEVFITHGLKRHCLF